MHCAFPDLPLSPASAQTEDLLIKRRSVLEKKMELELNKAKEYTKAKNKRGEA